MLLFLQKIFLWIHHNPKIGGFFKSLDRIIAGINKSVAVFGLAFGIVIVALNVSVRYIAGFYPDIGSLTWAEEVARYCFLWSAFFGSAYGFRKGVHISVTTLIEKFPPYLAKTCVIFSHLLSCVFLFFMFYASLMVCVLNYEIGYMSEALHNVPLWVFLLCLPIAFLGATYRSSEKVYEVSWMEAHKVVKNAEKEMIHDSVIKD
ncbi:TRAP transporter small permease [Helicobacter mesocricetorum]|uniref:TRAP transporter small permease n=1 Tax=Helicobacter mesocricetorum TaxID=87012 RepID=UPI000CF04B6D|nr:TRAP transporter small permease [Helicobacter mesocricetorum]